MSALELVAMAGESDSRPELAGVLESARSGDLAAFEGLMRRYERLVLMTALRLTGSLPDAQDISQEVFLKLYRNLGKVPGDSGLKAWMYRVTVNACHDARRRRRPETPVEEAGQLTASGDDPQQAMTEAERRRVLVLSLRVLAEKERAAIVLRDLEGLSTEEVAKVLGSSEATVRSQISKGRVKMKDFVERYFGEAAMNCAEWQERLALHAGGDVAHGVAEHLAECPECAEFHAEMREALESLRGIGSEEIGAAHYTAVRARVMAELAGSRPKWHRQAWIAAVAALLVVAIGALSWRASEPAVAAPPRMTASIPPAPLVKTQRAALPVKTRQHTKRPLLTIQLQTADPKIVIYWIAD